MADIPETVLLNQAVSTGLTQLYSLGVRYRCFLSYGTTYEILYVILIVVLDMLNVNF